MKQFVSFPEIQGVSKGGCRSASSIESKESDSVEHVNFRGSDWIDPQSDLGSNSLGDVVDLDVSVDVLPII